MNIFHTKQITAHFAEIMFEVDVLLQINCLFPPRSKAQIASEHFAYAYGLNAVLLSTALVCCFS